MRDQGVRLIAPRLPDDQERNEPELTFLPVFRREKRSRLIQWAKARLEARQREATRPGAQRRRWLPGPPSGWLGQGRWWLVQNASLVCRMTVIRKATDPDSRIGETRRWWPEQSYNVAIAVIFRAPIVAAELHSTAPRQSGAAGHAGKQFRPTPEKCRPRRWRMRDSVVRLFWQRSPITTAMSSLPSAARTQDAKVNAMTHPHTAAIAAKLKTEQGDAAYRRRKVDRGSEWLIKAVMGLRQFSMRGLIQVQAEWKPSSAWR